MKELHDIYVWVWLETVGSGWHFGKLIFLDKNTAVVQELDGRKKHTVDPQSIKMIEKIFIPELVNRLTSTAQEYILKNEKEVEPNNSEKVSQENVMTDQATSNQASQSQATAKAPKPAKVKSNSLTTLGFKIESLIGKADSKGNPFKYMVTSPRGTQFFIKQTKRAGLRAFRSLEAKDTVSIGNLYSFTETNGDLVGEPLSVKPAEAQTSADQNQAA